MAKLIKRNKALTVEPAKASQPVGAALAFMGIRDAIPMLHGSQGCTAFAKVFFVRHFREPIPLQTTAMDQVSTVMGGDESITEGLDVLSGGAKTRVVGLISTGLTECQGADIHRVVRQFRDSHPQHANKEVIAVNAADFKGCLESGYAHAVGSFIKAWLPERPATKGDAKRINLLVGPHLTPGDLERLLDTVERFGLKAVLLPDLSRSLDGHLAPDDFSPITTGGATVEDFQTIGDACATLVVGDIMNICADLIQERCGLADYRFSSLMGIEAWDRLLMVLMNLSGQPVPERFGHQRRQLQDAMLDTHFFLNQRKLALAGDPDFLSNWLPLFQENGLQPVAVVSPVGTDYLQKSLYETIKIGDLEDLQDLAREADAELFIGNSHVAALAQRLGRPILRAGYPLYDQIGSQSRCWIGYTGSRQALFDLANRMMHQEAHGLKPYISRYAPANDQPQEKDHHGCAADTSVAGG
ncbi:nitrogenase molybdenum-iron cofactor biosynthesis protein NifN [Magnetococcus marinus MC-1]|uniref:Nitrogenase iron-molybdenum cofactor biosynthesis protein NifN n=1 Tax=Magnetococcus marinus (strain ATCC BAA-1437 / JCM 17883 / MC-1) TaxID=156889 RepID=A0L6W2_MAGMM|nr:nitrogenase iron-molybdenum cofactor biosynthesis protein NifN [Magnetococcus marinus]ABK43705.1 nitrogenase molybdenum-iron cofactor biosynthesis protein NifN [Magnetococcus marinus MC-1]